MSESTEGLDSSILPGVQREDTSGEVSVSLEQLEVFELETFINGWVGWDPWSFWHSNESLSGNCPSLNISQVQISSEVLRHGSWPSIWLGWLSSSWLSSFTFILNSLLLLSIVGLLSFSILPLEGLVAPDSSIVLLSILIILTLENVVSINFLEEGLNVLSDQVGWEESLVASVFFL